MWNLSLGPPSILPLGRIASSVLIAPIDAKNVQSPFRVLVKPNQLVLWHPEQMYEEEGAADEDDAVENEAPGEGDTSEEEPEDLRVVAQ